MRILTLNKEDDKSTWFLKLKQFLQLEPQNQEELIELLHDAYTRSLIDLETLGMMQGVIHFAQMRVRDIMLPKKQMMTLSCNDTFDEVIHTVNTTGHSRFPVTDESKDHTILGIFHAKDLLQFQRASRSDFDLTELVRQPTFVPESKRLDLLLSEFRSNRNHMALVVDEYGNVPKK